MKRNLALASVLLLTALLAPVVLEKSHIPKSPAKPEAVVLSKPGLSSSTGATGAFTAAAALAAANGTPVSPSLSRPGGAAAALGAILQKMPAPLSTAEILSADTVTDASGARIERAIADTKARLGRVLVTHAAGGAAAGQALVFSADHVALSPRPGVAREAFLENLAAQGVSAEPVANEYAPIRVAATGARTPAELMALLAKAQAAAGGLGQAELDGLVSAASLTPNDPLFPRQWHLGDIHAPEAWDITQGDESIIVAIIDGGVQTDLPEFAGRVVPGLDLVNAGPEDGMDHGTAVASVAVGAGNNATGGAGVNWKCKIMPVKVMDGTGHGWSSDVTAGIQFAAKNGARVMNLSLGSYTRDDSQRYAVTKAVAQGCVIVAGAGNDALDMNATPSYPASYPGVIAVGALGTDNALAPFSNHGSSICVVAPGANIYATGPTGAASSWNGTSLASPQVAGAASLLLSCNPALTAAQVRALLIAGAKDEAGDSRDTPGFDDFYGWGRIDIFASLPRTSLVVNAAGGGSVTPEFAGATTRIVSTQATITATPEPGYMFTGWSGSITSAEPTISFPVEDGMSLTANFQSIYTATVNVSATEGGSVLPASLAGASIHHLGEALALEPQPAAGYVFAGWSGTITSSSPALAFTVSGETSVTANFVKNPIGAYAGRFSTLTRNGLLTVVIGKGGVWTASLRTVAGVAAFRGRLDPSGAGKIATGSYPLSFSLNAAAVPATITGTLKGPQGEDGFSALALPVFSAKARAPQAGAYTFVIVPGEGIPTEGLGYGSAVVSPAGAVSMAMVLSDGTRAAASGFVDSQGGIAFFAGNRAWSIGGTLTFAETSVSDFQGTLSWQHAATTAPVPYPQAFSGGAQIIGSRYVPAAAGNPGPFATPHLQMLVSGAGEVNGSFVSPVKAVFPSTSGVLTLNRASGLLSGAYVDQATKAVRRCGGAVIQKQSAAGGQVLLGAEIVPLEMTAVAP